MWNESRTYGLFSKPGFRAIGLPLYLPFALIKMSCGCVSQYQLREEPTLFVTTSTSLARFHTLHVWMEFVFVSTASCLPMILPAVRFYMTLTRVHFIPSRYQRICT